MTPIALAPPRDGRASSCEVPSTPGSSALAHPVIGGACREGFDERPVTEEPRVMAWKWSFKRADGARVSCANATRPLRKPAGMGARPDYGQSHIRQRRGQLTSEDPS
jgi:hypothetical protein